MKTTRRIAAVSAIAMSTFLMTCATAQAEDANAPAGSADIVVTATKRSESLNSVPMSISAASGADLAAAGVKSADDLAKIVPGFTFTQAAYSTPVYSLRGVGFYNYDLASTPAVTVYQDEAPLPFSAMTRGAGFDLSRVEVLKGPQGLLFGSNSTGGAINYIAAKPTDTLKAGFDAGYGNYNAWNLGGFVSGPLGEGVNARLAVNHEGQGDWQNSTTRAESNGSRDFTQARAQLEIKRDRFTAKLAFNAFWDKSDVQAAQLVQVNPLIPPFVNPTLPTMPLANGNARAADWTPGLSPKRNDNLYQGSGRFDYRLTDAVTLTSLTSYAHYKQDDRVDPDGTSLVLADTRDVGSVKAFYQELRASGDFGHGSHWIIGGNYERNTVQETQYLNSTDGSGFQPFAVLLHLPVPDTVPISSTQSFRNFAAFGNLDLAATDTVTLHAGLRYTNTRDAFVGCTGNSANGSLATGLGLLIYQDPMALGANPQCTQLDANLQPAVSTATLKQDNLSGRIGIDYKPDANTLLYANVSRGYKIGAFPLIPATSVTQYTPVSQEKLTAYEAGFKLSFAQHMVQLNGAVFYYDYRDKQTLGSVILTPNIFGPLNLLVNIPKSHVTGFELQTVLRPATGLTINAGLTYIDSKIGDFTNFDPYGAVKNFNGEAYPSTPKLQWVLAADYEFPVASNGKLFLGGNLSGRSATNGALGNNAVLNIDSYALLDLRAGFGSADDRWKVTFWGRNVTNHYYWTNAYKIADVSARFAGMPATYGASLSFRY